MDIRETLARNILRLMRKRGIDSQAELGRRSGVTQTAISNIERKAIYARTDTIEKLAIALRVNPSALLAPEDVSRLIQLWSACSDEARETLLSVAQSLAVSAPDGS